MSPKPREQATIELRLNSISQLFNSLDPSPFRQRDLDTEAEDFVVGWARELPVRARLRIVVYLPAAEFDRVDGREVRVALTHYFADRADAQRRELRELFRVGRRHFWVGVGVLAVTLTASQFVGRFITPVTLARLIEESLIIVGWVANWKTIEIFLYDWWPYRRRIALYERLANAAVSVEPDRV